MKVMISQPMKNRSNEEIFEERKELIRRIEENGDTVLATVLTEKDVEKDDPIYYLAESLKFIAQADKIIFMKGWEKARGCKIEHQVAVEYGKEIMYCN